MRTWFWLLLLVNVIVFALIQRGWVWKEGPTVQVQPSLHEEKIRVLDDSPVVLVAPAAKSRQTATASVAPASKNQPTSNSMTLQAASTPLASVDNSQKCFEWGDFSGTDLKLATDALTGMKLGNKLDKRQVDQVIRYWVYIPPLKSKAAVQQKIAQLKARGIEEYFVIQDNDPWRNAISLGVFKTQEAAQNFLDVLRTKDVRSARVGARAGKQKATIFILNGVDAATEARLIALKKDFPGSELKNVNCAH